MEKINFTVKDVKGANFGINDIAVKKVYPSLEDLNVIPTKEQQSFKSQNHYGYNIVNVEPIPDEYIIPEGTLPITENTTYDVTRFKRVSANVKPAPELQDKEATPTKETQSVTFDSGFDGLHTVTIKPIPDNYIEPTGTKEIKTEGTHDVTEYASVDVDVEPTLQDKQVTITENGTQNITADEGFDGLGNVEITTNAIEDLDEELNEYNEGLTTQEVTINDIARALQNKILGGEPSENKNIVETFYEAYLNYYNAFSPDYNKKYDTDEEVKLYTPNEAYQKYYILYCSDGTFMVCWSKNVLSKMSADGETLYWYNDLNVNMSGTIIDNGTKLTAFTQTMLLDGYNIVNSTTVCHYRKSGFATIEDAINALKSKDTTYALQQYKPNQITGMALYNDTSTSVVATNYFEVGSTSLLNECGRQLSSNENIVVIGTEV